MSQLFHFWVSSVGLKRVMCFEAALSDQKMQGQCFGDLGFRIVRLGGLACRVYDFKVFGGAEFWAFQGFQGFEQRVRRVSSGGGWRKSCAILK